MYEVMARRYRPAAFDEVVGQEHIAATLKNAIKRDRVAHAYLFAGGHGCGKTTMARIVARALVCERGPTPDPCGTCSICLDVSAGRDSDVLEIDGASNNGIEQIRQIRDQAGYVPNRDRFKIYIIDEAHMLSDSAFNALLKTLEEPPRHVKFILATTDPHKLPDTILSRCQRFDFRLVPQADLAALFRRLAGRENAAISDEALEAVAAFAGGSVRDGLVLLDQLFSFADGEVTRGDVESLRGVASAENVAGLFAAIAKADLPAALAVVDRVASRGTSVGDYLDQLIAFGRDLMIHAATGSLEGIGAYGPAKAAVTELAGNNGLETILLWLDVLAQARTRVRSRSLSNPLVALEMAVARLAGLGGLTPLSELISRLDSLPDLPLRAAAALPPPPPSAPAPAPPPSPSLQPEAAALGRERDAPGADETSEEKNVSLTPEAVAPPGRDHPEARPDSPDRPNVLDRGAAAPADSPESAADKWERVLGLMAEKHPADCRYLAKVRLLGGENDFLRLAGPDTIVEAWEDRRRRSRLAAALHEAFGREMGFAFAPIEAGIGGGAGEEAMAASRGLLGHPAVGRIKSLFDGVVVGCEPAGGRQAGDDGA
ncbi:MAG: DNA polymerase III subunit gamma/tau [Planctomycetota bacterium]|jgi:DNA polymerase-3 subunit gamma/tau|nr:DNA polymerase III subunit gamma/tau [Planctomycetota bacterium]